MASINDIIQTAPLLLPNGDEESLLGLFYLPYSTGFEIECDMKEGVNPLIFAEIPDIIHADINSSEQRFRIPQGLPGLRCLYNISTMMKEYGLLNENSGIHYHIDCTECFHLFNTDFIAKHSDYVLTELDTWEYTGTYNARICEFSQRRYWTRFKESTQTMEFRIGEMTFDYELLFKRITHCNEIVRTLKNNLYDNVEGDDKFGYYKDDYRNDVKNRIQKLW